MHNINPILEDLIKEADQIRDLTQIAFAILDRIESDAIGQVCGPITSGGLGSFKANIEHFNGAICKLASQGVIMFSQMPFEDQMQLIKQQHRLPGQVVLNDFYRPIFESGRIKTLYFLKGWPTSYGAKWERKEAKRLKINIMDLQY